MPVGPTPEADSTRKDWTTILGPTQKDDQEQCQAWDKEVQNILIFAALFSAAVTAFLIESYKLLRNQPTATGNQDTTENPSSSIRINVFWFMSLVLSLTTALIGIIAAQWLREHLSYPEYLTQEQMFALLNMKISMLKKWRVRGIISSLSVLLQIALLLFFAGLIQFLLALKVDAVTIPVAVVITTSILFPIVTTILPSLHIYTWQKETIVGGDVPIPCPYKSPQAELFYASAMFLSKYQPFPQLFSLFHALVTLVPTALITITSLVAFHIRRTLFFSALRVAGGVLVGLVATPILLLFSALKVLSIAADSIVRRLSAARVSVHGIIPIHYDRTMALFRPAMKDESECWWAFDVAWVSIRRDYAFRLYASRAWNRRKMQGTHASYIMNEWKMGQNDPPMVWGKATSREANAQAGPPWDLIQGLILLRRQYQHNDSDMNIMESVLRCFKSTVSSFRAYDKEDKGRPKVDKNSINWMIGFEDTTTEILRSHAKEGEEVTTFADLAHFKPSPGGRGVVLCTASAYHEALFQFIGNFHLERFSDHVRLKTTWAEIYYKLVHCMPGGEVLQHIAVPLAFATRSKNVSSMTEGFSTEEKEDVNRLYSKNAEACTKHFDKYRAEGANASEGLKNQVLHDFLFAIGAPSFYAGQAEVPNSVQKLVSSLFQFCQHLMIRDNPNVDDMAKKIENAFGDTVERYFEDSQVVFYRVAGPLLDNVPVVTQEAESLIPSFGMMPPETHRQVRSDIVHPIVPARRHHRVVDVRPPVMVHPQMPPETDRWERSEEVVMRPPVVVHTQMPPETDQWERSERLVMRPPAVVYTQMPPETDQWARSEMPPGEVRLASGVVEVRPPAMENSRYDMDAVRDPLELEPTKRVRRSDKRSTRAREHLTSHHDSEDERRRSPSRGPIYRSIAEVHSGTPSTSAHILDVSAQPAMRESGYAPPETTTTRHARRRGDDNTSRDRQS